MVVPSLNTIAEDDFRTFLPAGANYHVHRQRLRAKPGAVTVDDLRRANMDAEAACSLLCDLRPSAIAFNCTGASVASGRRSHHLLAERLTRSLGVPATNTMLAIAHALTQLGARSIVHVCPFEGESATIERVALQDDGFEVIESVALGFTDARQAALMTPDEIAELACRKDRADADAILLSCANVRAFEAAELAEQRTGKPVVTSNQAMLWDVLRLAGWEGRIERGGRLLDGAVPHRR